MKRPVLLALALASATLSACAIRQDNEPRQICAVWSAPYLTRSGAMTRDCAEYKIGCLRPLILDELGDTLICRLRRPEEQTPQQG